MNSEGRKRRPFLVVVVLLSMLGLGAALSIGIPGRASAAEWLGGVQYTHVFHKYKTAWDFFLAGEPTENGYNHALRDCKAMGGDYITKAGTGTISDLRNGRYMVTFDFSCWASEKDLPDPTSGVPS